MRRFDTVLFDLDGTLLDTLEDICGAANHTLRELGYPERTLAEMRRFVGNGAEMQMRRALGADADEETVCAPAPIMKPCINLPSAARKRIGWWGSMPRAFSPSSITAP